MSRRSSASGRPRASSHAVASSAARQKSGPLERAARRHSLMCARSAIAEAGRAPPRHSPAAAPSSSPASAPTQGRTGRTAPPTGWSPNASGKVSRPPPAGAIAGLTSTVSGGTCARS